MCRALNGVRASVVDVILAAGGVGETYSLVAPRMLMPRKLRRVLYLVEGSGGLVIEGL